MHHPEDNEDRFKPKHTQRQLQNEMKILIDNFYSENKK